MKTKIELIQGDITTLKVNAIVNAANKSLLGGGGVDGAIHKAAGSKLLDECRTLNGCNTGEAKITKGYDLPSKYVIHTVGPVWHGGKNNENTLLQKCYYNSLMLAAENNCKTLAFPNISTGVYGYPKEQAAKVAINTVNDFINSNDQLDKIYFVCFDKENYGLYSDLMSG